MRMPQSPQGQISGMFTEASGLEAGMQIGN
jgi:hypothetical protein